MCGINFILNKKSEKVSPGIIERANSALSHRGPDESSKYFFENTVLGHTRLSIVDVSGGHQPLFNEDKSAVIICNGEIYNYQAIRKRLEEKGHRFGTHSDCEVIIHLYEEDPQNYITELDGMFSFVLLDMKKRVVHVARDRVGIKPLYYFENAEHFICSSEIKGILATGLTPRELNRQGIYDCFTFGYLPEKNTCFREIKTFPPATIFSYNLAANSSEARYYWDLRFPSRKKSEALRYPQYVGKLKEVFEQAIASHVIGDFPMGAYLSGGIDSTITSTLLKKLLGREQTLKTFSIKFANKEFDESDSFEKTSAELGFDSHVLELDSLDLATFQKVIFHLEQPQFSPLDGPMFLLSKFVHDAGIKVVCVGEGSDELFGGYNSYTLNQIRAVFSTQALRPLKPHLFEKVLSYYVSHPELRAAFMRIYGENQNEVIKKFGFYPPWYPLWSINSEFKKPVFGAGLEDSFSEGSAMQKMCADLKSGSKSSLSFTNDFDKAIYLEMKTRLPNYILLRGDRNSMAHGVEARVPFLDNEVIDYVAKIPPLYKMFGFKEKFILRQAFKPLLPKHILKRRKYGFVAPNSWLWEKKSERINELLSASALKKTGVFDVQGVENYRKEVESGTLHPHSLRYNFIYNTLTGVLSTQMLHEELIEGLSSKLASAA